MPEQENRKDNGTAKGTRSEALISAEEMLTKIRTHSASAKIYADRGEFDNADRELNLAGHEIARLTGHAVGWRGRVSDSQDIDAYQLQGTNTHEAISSYILAAKQRSQK
jgi:GH35 family endo-1,4-beta-xylanase